MSLLIINIAGLVQVRAADFDYVRGNSMQELPEMLNAWCYIENDKIIDFGEMDQCPYRAIAGLPTGHRWRAVSKAPCARSLRRG